MGILLFLASILVFGSMLGSLTGGLQCQFLGRKKSLIIDNIVVFGSLMTLSFSHNYISLLICRFCLGVSVASLRVNVPSYTGEICQPKVRMLTGSFVMVCNSGGMSTMMVIGAMLNWRTAIQILAGFPILVIILVTIFVPESPIWLIMNNKHSDAKESLMKLRAGSKFIVEIESMRMQNALEQQNAELKEDTTDHEYCSGILEVFNALRDKCFLKPFMILLVLFCIGFEWAGLPFIAYYMVGILIEADIPFDPYLASAGISLFRLVLILIFSFGIANRIRRRPLYLSTGVGIVLGNLALATYFCFRDGSNMIISFPVLKCVPVISMLIIYTSVSMGYGSVPYMLQGEILPPYARSVGSGLLGLCANICMFSAAKFGPTISESIGIGGAFYVFSGCAIATLLFGYFTMPETFNLSLEEIEKIYQDKVEENVIPKRSSRNLRSSSIISFYEIVTPYNK